MKRRKLEREESNINICNQIYYHIEKKILVINFNLYTTNINMFFGCEWNHYMMGDMELDVDGFSLFFDKYVKKYYS